MTDEKPLQADDLEDFDPQRVCPACAWPVLSFKYIEAKTQMLDSEYEEELAPEHLLRVCERCGREIKMKVSEGDTDELGHPV